MKHLSFPEALYMVNLSVADITNPGPPLMHIAVDAHDFISVEDWAKEITSKGFVLDAYEVTGIEKTYVYSKMFAGDDGERIDVQITDKKGFKFTEHGLQNIVKPALDAIPNRTMAAS